MKVEINNIFAEIKNQAHLNKLTEITTQNRIEHVKMKAQ
jgi:hypothetical protein